jgi:hypothetical protein
MSERGDRVEEFLRKSGKTVVAEIHMDQILEEKQRNTSEREDGVVGKCPAYLQL